MLNALIFVSEMTEEGFKLSNPAPEVFPYLPGLFHSLIYAVFGIRSSIEPPLFVNSLGVK